MKRMAFIAFLVWTLIIFASFASASAKELNIRYPEKEYKVWKKVFSKNKKKLHKKFFNGSKYYEVVKDVFRRHNLPEDLFFVGVVESGFFSHAQSRAKAHGYWQFMKKTGKGFGLRIDSTVDERRNIYKSTNAAAMYFKDLYNIFGSWELALSAYNAGEYRIINIIKKHNTRDYVQLVRKKALPRDTRNYVAQVAAARDLFKSYNQVPGKKAGKKYNSVKRMKATSSFSARKMAKKMGLSTKYFKELNRCIRRDLVKASRRNPFYFYVPDLSKKKAASSRGVASSRSYLKHTVKSGDSLYAVAKKYGLSLSKLKKLNDLKSTTIFKGQKLKVKALYQNYIVQSGDSLGKIARRFNVSVKSLIAKNLLKNDIIRPSQKLIIPL